MNKKQAHACVFAITGVTQCPVRSNFRLMPDALLEYCAICPFRLNHMKTNTGKLMSQLKELGMDKWIDHIIKKPAAKKEKPSSSAQMEMIVALFVSQMQQQQNYMNSFMRMIADCVRKRD